MAVDPASSSAAGHVELVADDQAARRAPLHDSRVSLEYRHQDAVDKAAIITAAGNQAIEAAHQRYEKTTRPTTAP